MTYRFVGANFDQMHMETNLEWVVDHPDAELVGICDEDPSTSTGSLPRAAENLGVPESDRYDDVEAMLEATDPDVAILCPMNSKHPEYVERAAAYDVHVAIEKPLAASLADADRMLEATSGTGNLFAVNWPVTWSPVKHTVKRLVEEGTIGEIVETQVYGGNAGAPPEGSWFYRPECGGGSLLDYLGYGATFATWFRGGELPESVTTETFVPADLEVDTQSTSVARYEDGLGTFGTSWNTFTHPWEIEPQPAKGYDLVGTRGTISTRTRGEEIFVQTEARPEGFAVEPDDLDPAYADLVSYLVHCLDEGVEPEGPTDPEFCRAAQRVIETARRSAERGERVELVG
jgi:glucose-fructose oxidoreductase